MKIVIKVGTQAILSADGSLQETVMQELTRNISQMQKDGHQVALVSSGAVGSGRRVAKALLNRTFGNSIGEKQMMASMGQHELMAAYAQTFRPHGIAVAQLLLTKQDFQTRLHYLNIARVLREVLGQKNIVPVINENDSVAVEELMFTDNDELAGLVAAQINADKLIIFTSVAGVFDGPPDLAGSKLITLIDPQKDGWPEVSATKSTQGRGGMMTKLGTARKMSDLGITTHIVSINEKDALVRILSGTPPGTTVLPMRKKSNVKKWMAYSADPHAGNIRINAPLLDLLRDNNRILSILPVGLEDCAGNFKKGDLIDILAPDGKIIGIGIARYGADKLRECIGKKGMPEIIHYDHLHVHTGA